MASAVVKELMIDNENNWNKELVSKIFQEEESQAIMNIPLGKLMRKDRLI